VSNLHELAIEELAQKRRASVTSAHQLAAATDLFCYELFRRAIVEHDQQAWSALVERLSADCPRQQMRRSRL
jgi:hypothetical protein